MPNDDIEKPLLVEIRDSYKYLEAAWHEIYTEGRIDMRYLSGDPWDPKERKAREKSDRLILSYDELNQYINQVVNNLRQNPRSVRVVPKGNGATDITAEKRANIIREIEYKSKAQAAIRTAFEGAVQRGFGFYKFKTQWVSDSSDDQELAYVRIPNPETILIDWDTKEADCSDMEYAFEFELLRRKRYQDKYPEAHHQFFNIELNTIAPVWVKEDQQMVASYWKLYKNPDKLFTFPNRTKEKLSVLKERFGKVKVRGNFLEIEGQKPLEFSRWRDTEDRQVKQYITNGLEILEERDWPGRQIPIIPVLGRELWIDEGGGAKRMFLSLTRLARNPYAAYCYTRTCQMEIVQQSPKTMWEGFIGQFDTKTDWRNVHKVPTAYVEFNLTTPQSEEAGGGGAGQILPLPRRQVFDASGIQALELTAEAHRRAIQAAMGVTGLLNGTQDTEARSGVALKTLNSQENTGSFHFIDNLEGSLENGGRQLNELLNVVYDGTRNQGMRTATGRHYTEDINVLGVQGEKLGFHTDMGEHDVDIDTGPTYDDQRAEVSEFAEQLMTAANGAFAGDVIDLIIRLRNMGPLGDEMAKRFEQKRQQQIPPVIQKQMQQMAAKLQQLQMEKQSKTQEITGKAWIANAQQQTELEKKRYDLISSLGQALIKAGQANDAAAFAAQIEHLTMLWEQAHEFNMQQVALAAPQSSPMAQPQQIAAPIVQQPQA